MSKFTKDLVVKRVGNRLWEIVEPFDYHVGREGSGDIITVPKGFVTDFASIPRAFWMIMPPDGEYTNAAVIHDYLYNIQTRTRKQSDDIFKEAMKVLGVNWFRRGTMYNAVRSFGWIPWNHHARQLKKTSSV